MATPPTKILSEKQAAERLNRSHRTMQRWRLVGTGPEYVKLGRSIGYTESDLEKFIAAAKRVSTSESAEDRRRRMEQRGPGNE